MSLDGDLQLMQICFELIGPFFLLVLEYLCPIYNLVLKVFK